ncbi:MAG: hypothetical protein MN733_24470 [Nitrososphaera sp.]|nr:hypothetical protein [Nitrososphaera sp.]
MTTAPSDKGAAENLPAGSKLGLKAKYERFVSEGGSGRSNTNTILRILVDEIEALKEANSKKNRQP